MALLGLVDDLTCRTLTYASDTTYRRTATGLLLAGLVRFLTWTPKVPPNELATDPNLLESYKKGSVHLNSLENAFVRHSVLLTLTGTWKSSATASTTWLDFASTRLYHRPVRVC